MTRTLPLLKSNPVISERDLVVMERNSIRAQFGDVYRREVEELSRFPFALPEFLFRLFVLGDIDGGPGKLHKVAQLVQDGMAYGMEMLDRSTGKNNAVVRLIIFFLNLATFKELLNVLLVVGMAPAKPKVRSRNVLIRLHTEYSKNFRRDCDCP
jgi:hypothetical protein